MQARCPGLFNERSSSASGWLTTRMELVADVLDDLLHGAATDFAFLDFARAPVNHLPLRIRVNVHGIIKAGDELSNAHAAKTSANPRVLTSSMMLCKSVEASASQ
jgi:hypothetical protein